MGQDFILLTTEHRSKENPTSQRELRLVVNAPKEDGNEPSTSNDSVIEGALMIADPTMKQVDEMFPRGYTSSKSISNLMELRDALNMLLLPKEDDFIKPTSQQKRPEQYSSSSRSEVYHSARQEYEIATMDEMRRFELFRKVIEHEDDLLNHRVSWIILAQSFLMAAYITTSGDNNLLRFVTAGVGLFTVIVTLPAILAAGRNVEVQQQVYFNLIESDERCIQLHGHKRDLSTKPSSDELKERLKEGHILPNMAFRSRASIKILWTALFLAVVQSIGWILLLLAVILDWDFCAIMN